MHPRSEVRPGSGWGRFDIRGYGLVFGIIFGAEFLVSGLREQNTAFIDDSIASNAHTDTYRVTSTTVIETRRTTPVNLGSVEIPSLQHGTRSLVTRVPLCQVSERNFKECLLNNIHYEKEKQRVAGQRTILSLRLWRWGLASLSLIRICSPFMDGKAPVRG